MKDCSVKGIARKALPAACYSELAKWWRYLPNIGFKHKCPICGKYVKAFLPFGLQPRPNALCPFCDSLERHRSLWVFLSNRTDLLSGEVTVLHLAPESCLRTKLSQLPGINYVTADMDPTRAAMSMDIQFIPFQDSSFDGILCSHVLEHVPDDRKAMREMFRILRPGGWAILQVPLDSTRDKTFEDADVILPEERRRVFGQWDHVRIYGRDYKRRLADAGFTVQFDSYINELPAETILKYGLSTQDIFLASKVQKSL